jgi:hypothetical protein
VKKMAHKNESDNTSNEKGIVPGPRVFIGSLSKGKKIAEVAAKLIEYNVK